MGASACSCAAESVERLKQAAEQARFCQQVTRLIHTGPCQMLSMRMQHRVHALLYGGGCLTRKRHGYGKGTAIYAKVKQRGCALATVHQHLKVG
eukprot:1215919-Pleurochrysis_carterae.AAC.1